MPIPFLVGAAVVGFSVAARGVNKDMKEEINEIYDEINSIVQKTNENAEKEMELFNKALELNDNKKSGIVEYIIAPFVDELNKIKNCELKKRLDSGEVKKILNIDSSEYDIKRYNSTAVQKIWDAVKDSYVVLSGIGGVGMSYVEYKKLDSKKTIAEGKLEEVKLQCEEVNNQVAAMKEMRKQVNEVTEVLTTMEQKLRIAYFAFFNMTKESGYDYNCYSKNEQRALMLIVDIFSTVNSVIVNPVIKQDGSFNQELINNSLSVVELVESNEDKLGDM